MPNEEIKILIVTLTTDNKTEENPNTFGYIVNDIISRKYLRKQ